jgi:polygalacturonase
MRSISILFISVLFCFAPNPYTNPFKGVTSQKSDVTYNVKNFGARGDGKSNDYKAILAAVKHINKFGAGTLYFPKGIYIIKEFHTKVNSLQDIVFKDCKGLNVRGDNAVVMVNGNFHRGVDYKKGGFQYSKSSSVVPFSFINCSNVSITGFEVVGNANTTTRGTGVVEGNGHLLSFNGCKQVVVKNVYVHHAQTDGIYIKGASKDFTFTDVSSANNARQGMSIIQLENGLFTRCTFKNTGITGGAYGSHKPAAGVDIEPHGSKSILVNNVTFKKCSFENNKGGQFICTSPGATSNITVDDSSISANESTSKYQMILAANNILIRNSKIDCGSGNIYPVWAKMAGSLVTISSCTIRSKASGIIGVSRSALNKTVIEGNILEYTGPGMMNSYFPYLQLTNLHFIGNKVIIPNGRLNPKRPPSLLQNAEVSSNNSFISGNRSFKHRVSYSATKMVKDNG